MQFRLLTYNIHKGIGGVDRRYDLDRVASVIADCNPDVVFLQEVDENVARSDHHNQVEILSEQLALPHTAFQVNVSVKEGGYGNAILCRHPLTAPRDLDLTIPLKKNRKALIADCQIEGFQITLCNVHLGLWSIERRMQLKKLIDSGEVETPRSVIAGDFNDVYGRLGNKTLRPHGFETSGRTRTFPAWLPMMPLDRIYCRGMSLHALEKYNQGEAKKASDHLPLVADIRLDKDAGDQ